MTAEQVGPAPGKPTTMLALEAAVIDWLPGARIPSWPGAPGGFTKKEAGDTFAVRPVQIAHRRIGATTTTTLEPQRHPRIVRPAAELHQERPQRGLARAGAPPLQPVNAVT